MAAIEVQKELVDKIYEVIEVAKASGKIKKGTNETTKSIEKGKAKLVVIAKDISPPEITMHIPLIAEEKNVPCFQVPSKEDLGAAAGIQVGTGSVAVTQEGEAKNLIKELLIKTKQ
ncbi:50S ribosomal protein L7ae [Candidatus Woesearchaeota archaeon]|mgnify:CR=1 FL=1|nr:50S ribosomal protein L7ae [Candidatus Woesearchaeota archaeon]|tara:strand:- start:1257 stop:1604 length:348 start_codon:yes stop_codon:yes gene_type:complete